MSYNMNAAIIAAINDKYLGWPHGQGVNYSTGRTLLTPHPLARRIHVDGTTSGPDANLNYSAASLAAGQALVRAGFGDWILFPAGGSTTVAYGSMIVNAGLSAAYPHVIGTYDPTDELNVSKYNTGARYTWDGTGQGSGGAICWQAFSNGGNFAIVNQYIKAGAADAGRVGMFTLGAQPNILVENCIFDGLEFDIGADLTGTTPHMSMLDSALCTNVTFNQCGLGFANSQTNGRSGCGYFNCCRHVRLVQCVVYHGGWSRGMTRATPPWAIGAAQTISTLTSVGTTATATTSAAHGLSTGMYVVIQGVAPTAYNKNPTIITVLNTTQFTYTITSVGGVAGAWDTVATTPSTMQWCDAQANGWTAAAGSGPDQYKHGMYISQDSDDIRITDCVTAWDSANDKWTGGNYTVRNHVSIRMPMGPITAPNGNDASFATWPANAQFKILNHLQVNSSDITTTRIADNRGWGSSLYMQNAASEYTGAVVLNQDNQTSANRIGLQGNSNGFAIATYLNVNHAIVANWGQNNASNEANTTKTWRYVISDDAAALPGATNVLRTAASAAMQSAITAALALNVHTTFRTATPELAGVTVNADPLVTEQNVCEYMMLHPEINWANRLQKHFRPAVGR